MKDDTAIEVMSNSSENSVKRNVVRRSSLEEAARYNTNLSQAPTAGAFGALSEKQQIHFVPSTLKSTLGSPVSISQSFFRHHADTHRPHLPLVPSLRH